MSQLSTFYPAPITATDLGLGPASNATFGSIQNTPIGSTTPNSGAFTTLAATSSVGVPNGARTDLSVRFADDTDTGFYLRGANTLCFVNGGNNRFDITSTQFRFAVGTVFGWTFNDLSGSLDLQLHRDEADTLALHRGSNPQALRLYNTYTNASNYERGFMRWSSNVLQIGTEKAGTGSARNLELVVDGTTRMIIDTSGQVGIGNGVSLNRPFHIYGTTAWGRIDRVGTVGPAWLMVRMSTGQTVASSWLFGPLCGAGSTVAGVTDDDFAISDFGTSISGTAGTARLTISKSTGQLTVNGNLNLSTKDLVTDTTTGTKIGTGTTQKIGFFNATPVVQQAAIADATDAATTQARLNDLLATMRTLGLIAT